MFVETFAQPSPSKLLVYATLILLLCNHTFSLRHPVLTNVTDWRALLSIKSAISTNPEGSLPYWNNSVHYCRCRHPQRVIFLELETLGLDGFISAAIANLTFLRKIDLSGNQINGLIPHEIGRLRGLRYLNLSMNSLGGSVPSSVSHCSRLQVIGLSSNMLEGEIPSVLGNCLDLRILSLSNNHLEGKIPLSLTNLSFLDVLCLGSNDLSGEIPSLMGKLYRLTELDLSGNRLTGFIPASLWNLSALSQLNVADNYLLGVLPTNAGYSLTLLRKIYVYNNRFHGPIPMSLFNASTLEVVDFSSNRFIGEIPQNLGGLRKLRWLNLLDNQLELRKDEGWSFLTGLCNCTNLEKLQLGSNSLGGLLPNSIANLSTKLQILSMSDNEISGNIFHEIGNLVSLTVFDMGQNLLRGSIPAPIGLLTNLHVLDLGTNKLSGEVPSTLGNLTLLNSLHLGSNELSGMIPPNLGNCQNLISLNLSNNKLTGGIPKEILTISTLSIYLDLARNSLTGSLPAEVGSLKNLGEIDFSRNNLSGELPSSLGKCQVLKNLRISNNFIHGNISLALSTLRGMQELDLSQNNLSGQIPYVLQDFPFLYYINLSYNNFEGEVPRNGVFANASAVSVLGNNNLCGGNSMLQLPPCTFQSTWKKYWFATLSLIIAFGIIGVCLFLIFCWMQTPRKEPINIESIYVQGRISYAKLMRATNGFSADNLIGLGSFGAVYRGKIDDDDKDSMFRGMQIAVKVLNLQQHGASKSFTTECDVLKNMIHRNIIKILTTCSGVDSMGNDFKAIVYEFMANGSLESWLHPDVNEQGETKKLNFLQRINIAIDVASGLYRLHKGGEKPIIHCDIKPSNILLDEDMAACVSDLGLARGPVEALVRTSLHTINSYGFKGTIGYVAPGEKLCTILFFVLLFT
ncbi:receptor kinase-like protein Xa21 [Asparagus officinalis]|uniref:receptor kinase-like protein Xa21 n=1 Tax=Asparagus officinalis TaxID=4686 RepID=UPI00098E223B|nr:receptor kinase-like protein Xa21 [Asparagus officinalis]